MYVVGWNVPGYLPDGETAEFESWAEARDALYGDLEDALDVARAEDRVVEVEQAKLALFWLARSTEAECLRDGGDAYPVGQWSYWLVPAHW